VDAGPVWPERPAAGAFPVVAYGWAFTVKGISGLGRLRRAGPVHARILRISAHGIPVYASSRRLLAQTQDSVPTLEKLAPPPVGLPAHPSLRTSPTGKRRPGHSARYYPSAIHFPWKPWVRKTMNPSRRSRRPPTRFSLPRSNMFPQYATYPACDAEGGRRAHHAHSDDPRPPVRPPRTARALPGRRLSPPPGGPGLVHGPGRPGLPGRSGRAPNNRLSPLGLRPGLRRAGPGVPRALNPPERQPKPDSLQPPIPEASPGFSPESANPPEPSLASSLPEQLGRSSAK